MATKTRPTDFTGRERERLIKENADELALRAEEMSIATASQIERESKEVIDYSESPSAPTVIDDIESVGVSLADDFVVVQVLEDLEQMTFGAGNYYTFVAGKKYKVPRAVAEHLKDKGYVFGF